MIYLVTNQRSAFNPIGYSILSVKESLEMLSSWDSIAFDSETEGFDPYTKGLISVQFGNADTQFVVDCKTVDVRLYKSLLETREILMQNAKFDLAFLYHKKIVPTKIYDTMLVERILTTGDDRARRALDFLTYKYCKKEMDKTVRGVIHKEGLSTRVIKYAADDVKYLHEIKRKQMVEIEKHDLVKTVSLDNYYVSVLAYIEYCGVFLDTEKWSKKCDEDKANMKSVKDLLDGYILENSDTYPEFINQQLTLFEEGVSCNINWNSEKQVIPLMKRLGVNTQVKDKVSGLMKDSVDKKVLTSQKEKFKLVKIYLKYKEYQKEVSTYGYNFLDYINPVSGRIHTNYTQIMSTGRLSSGQKGNKKKNIAQKPNMQNIPSDDRTRNCFTAQNTNTNTLIVSDYSGQEQIVLANKSKDVDLLDFYEKGMGDMHSFVASKIFLELNDVSLADIKKLHKDKRQIAKGAGFAINYGGTGITIAQNLSLPLNKGEEVYEAYFKAFPGLSLYFRKEKQKVLNLGYIEFNEVSKRKCFIWFYEDFKRLEKTVQEKGFWAKYKQEKLGNTDLFNNELKPLVREYFMKKGDMERMSLNYPIQGSSADITKLAGIYAFRELKKRGLLFKVLMPNVVHDELHLECDKSIANEMAELLKNCMEKAGDRFCKTIKLKAEPCITKVWAH
ncbi:MAG: putative DNA polymerase [Prokaryotic dsDNA virus sp.]|nr:MAG: putative DNA polymerase [Prokaryotic dsDNA virus sp.]|tara:strand:- start:4412 stop:6424 length:2013 start_codon:yes stop_codon:yes gene_type:complete